MPITITNHQLSSLLRPVLPFAGDPRVTFGLPVLATVLLQRRGDHLYATATDRYHLGSKRVAVDDMPDDFNPNLLLNVAELAQVVSLFRASQRGGPRSPQLTLEYGADAVTFTAVPDDARPHPLGSLRAGVRAVQGPYPNVFSLLRQYLAAADRDDDTSPSVTLGMRLLLDLRAAHQWTDAGNSPITLTNGTTAGKAVIAQIGDDFLGLIMPTNMAAMGDRGGAPLPFQRAMKSWAAATDDLEAGLRAADLINGDPS